VRYYLVRNLSFAQDGDFLRSGLLRALTMNWHDLGNLLNRVVTMIQRYRKGAIPAPGPIGELEADLQQLAQKTARQAADAWKPGKSAKLSHHWSFVRRVNQYIEQSEALETGEIC